MIAVGEIILHSKPNFQLQENSSGLDFIIKLMLILSSIPEFSLMFNFRRSDFPKFELRELSMWDFYKKKNLELESIFAVLNHFKPGKTDVTFIST